MKREDVFKLYEKEREYQDKKFGGEENDTKYGVGGFLVFINKYLNDAMVSLTSSEIEDALNEIVKIMALAGSALENFGDIDVEKWRENND